jgi:multidrug transporter EmrE-like cation transporter
MIHLNSTHHQLTIHIKYSIAKGFGIMNTVCIPVKRCKQRLRLFNILSA